MPLKPFDEWPSGYNKEKLIEDLQSEFGKEFVGIDFNFSQYIQDNVEEGAIGRQRRQFHSQDYRTGSGDLGEDSPGRHGHEMAKVQGIADLEDLPSGYLGSRT